MAPKEGQSDNLMETFSQLRFPLLGWPYLVSSWHKTGQYRGPWVSEFHCKELVKSGPLAKPRNFVCGIKNKGTGKRWHRMLHTTSCEQRETRVSLTSWTASSQGYLKHGPHSQTSMFASPDPYTGACAFSHPNWKTLETGGANEYYQVGGAHVQQ